jgi:hypothetical protein
MHPFPIHGTMAATHYPRPWHKQHSLTLFWWRDRSRLYSASAPAPLRGSWRPRPTTTVGPPPPRLPARAPIGPFSPTSPSLSSHAAIPLRRRRRPLLSAGPAGSSLRPQPMREGARERGGVPYSAQGRQALPCARSRRGKVRGGEVGGGRERSRGYRAEVLAKDG